MAYSAYETVAGTSALRTVESWCRHLTSAGTFGTASAPTLAQVETFITLAQAELMGKLVRYGYGTAAPSNTAGLAWLENMNTVRAVMKVELTYPVTETGEGNERYKEFRTQWEEGLEDLASGQLDIGLAVPSSNMSDGLEFTGTSEARIRSRQEDTDRVGGRFRRGFGGSHRAVPINNPYTQEVNPDYNG